jgi:Flp pilus assembly protein TadB
MVALPSILLLSIAGGFVCWMKKREKTSRQAELAATGWSHAFVAQEQQQQQQQQQKQTIETKATHQQHNNINHPAAASLPPLISRKIL